MTKPQPSLSDVLYWFALEEVEPTADLINDYRLRFPLYADAIADFAIELSVDALRTVETETALGLTDPPSNAVMRAISDFQNLRYEEKHRSNEERPAQAIRETTARANPFKQLASHHQYRQFASDVGISNQFALKLKERQIAFETIPAAFTQRIATSLGVPVDILAAYLSAPPSSEASALFYKAVDKPVRQPQETFEQAVRTSNMSPTQQQHLLSL
jgi:transcriptional regulator with XRE-family HTH domain